MAPAGAGAAPGRTAGAAPSRHAGLPRLRGLVLLTSCLFCTASAQGNTIASAGITSASYGWLSGERALFCKDVPTPPPKLDELADFPAVAYETQDNFDRRELIQGFRGENAMTDLVRKCPLVSADDTENSECSAEVTSYGSSLVLFTAPLICGFVTLALWQVCCLVWACRCCRRCCLCAERKASREARGWQKMVVVAVAIVCTIAIFATAVVAYMRSTQISGGMSDMLCNLLTMADETLNGSGDLPIFLGVDVGIQRLALLRRLLDVDGQSMTDVRAILDQTANFASAMDDLTMKINHMMRVLTIVGQHKMKEHMCWFCQRAVGNNATGSLGLLNELKLEIQQSSADAMRSIQTAAASTLTGRPLVDVSQAVRRGGLALDVFKRGYAGAVVESFAANRDTMQALEDGRHTVFRSLCAFCIVEALVVSNAAVFYTRRSKAKWPSAALSCVTWFCAFCSMAFALLFAGSMLLIAVPLSEICSFWRYDLMTHEGIADYYWQMGLYEPSDVHQRQDPLAVDVWRTCLTPNGTGDILNALQLQERLQFQQVLDERFLDLEDKMAGRVVDLAKFELLVLQAQEFGGLFQLDPDEPLPLEPNAAPRIIGSSLDADDQEGPDGETLIFGLNTFAGLIAGAGQYWFQHGTAGGGTVITATTPTEAEVSSLPLQMQNALTYARLKEQILSEPAIFRCDILDSRFQVQERHCGFEEYKLSVLEWATQVRDAGVRLGQEAQLAKQNIAFNLKSSLQGVLLEVRELRTLFQCRFLWRRWEDFDFALCNNALPGMLESSIVWLALAAFTLLLLVTHYKIWRHLLDNRVVGEELERFSNKYGYLNHHHIQHQIVKA